MDIALLPIKPGTMSAEDKAMLREAGVVVVEHEESHTLRLLTPTAELGGGDLFACAMHALAGPSNSASSSCQADFTRAVAALVRQQRRDVT
jgi:hypothetical protein